MPCLRFDEWNISESFVRDAGLKHFPSSSGYRGKARLLKSRGVNPESPLVFIHFGRARVKLSPSKSALFYKGIEFVLHKLLSGLSFSLYKENERLEKY